LLLALLVGLAPSFAQELEAIALPKPQWEGGKPLMEVLKERKSSREFGAEKLPLQVVSNLLWAAFGVNRADGRRTAPSSSNRQEIDIYVATADGVYLYEAQAHLLKPLLAADIRAKTGTQPFVAEAPMNLIYVADYAKMREATPEDKAVTAAADTGFISQNVYLFCTSEGLATVVRGSVDREGLAKALNLGPDLRITYAQTVGYPKK
jgi:SagB-type dehydrogenase family enzyme